MPSSYWMTHASLLCPQGLNADVQSYQAAISERLGNFLHNLAMFGGGIGVGEGNFVLLTKNECRQCALNRSTAL